MCWWPIAQRDPRTRCRTQSMVHCNNILPYRLPLDWLPHRLQPHRLQPHRPQPHRLHRLSYLAGSSIASSVSTFAIHLAVQCIKNVSQQSERIVYIKQALARLTNALANRGVAYLDSTCGPNSSSVDRSPASLSLSPTLSSPTLTSSSRQFSGMPAVAPPTVSLPTVSLPVALPARRSFSRSARRTSHSVVMD